MSTSTHTPTRRSGRTGPRPGPGLTPQIRTTDLDRERKRCKRSGCRWLAVIDATDGLCMLCHERAKRPDSERKRYKVCLMPDCDRPHKAQGLCDTHYWRVRNDSPTPLDEPIRPKAPSVKRADAWRYSMSIGGSNSTKPTPPADLDLDLGNTGSVPVPPPADVPSTAGKVKVSDRRKPELRAAPPGGWPRTCSRPGCERKHEAQGLCRAHYERDRRKRKRREAREAAAAGRR